MSTHKAWKDALANPMYPVEKMAYTIDVSKPPATGNKDGLYYVHTVDGKTLQLWSSTFMMLASLLADEGYKDTKVIFYRAEGSKVTLVAKVK